MILGFSLKHGCLSSGARPHKSPRSHHHKKVYHNQIIIITIVLLNDTHSYSSPSSARISSYYPHVEVSDSSWGVPLNHPSQTRPF